MSDEGAVEERLAHLLQLEEARFIVGFHQQVEKDRQKAWNDRHVTMKNFPWEDMVLLYDNKFAKNLGKIHIHWLGPYIINCITSGGAVQLQNLDGTLLPNLVNISQLNPYRDSQA